MCSVKVYGMRMSVIFSLEIFSVVVFVREVIDSGDFVCPIWCHVTALSTVSLNDVAFFVISIANVSEHIII